MALKVSVSNAVPERLMRSVYKEGITMVMDGGKWVFPQSCFYCVPDRPAEVTNNTVTEADGDDLNIKTA